MVIITRERTARADQELARIDASIIGKLPGRLLCTLPSLITIEHLVKQKNSNSTNRLADQLCLDYSVVVRSIDSCIAYGPINGCMYEMAEIWAMRAGHSAICKVHAVVVTSTRHEISTLLLYGEQVVVNGVR